MRWVSVWVSRCGIPAVCCEARGEGASRSSKRGRYLTSLYVRSAACSVCSTGSSSSRVSERPATSDCEERRQGSR
eukprot:6196617-Pleurochrysis_carterae.AAC.2